ncbi:hypothetical protein Arub01_57600 [Actinomadura rubrobrunea]|uniref:Uncharacterized protein n=1 Tax=Actinomadura rubrobrunea TaxID=115335 RepID=A0A9W6UZR9_9ACTN|nr:hypothetical protein Arub01_57600 [Actinomadura rubrobrunea]
MAVHDRPGRVGARRHGDEREQERHADRRANGPPRGNQVFWGAGEWEPGPQSEDVTVIADRARAAGRSLIVGR